MSASGTLTIGTGRSIVVDRCQVCGSGELDPALFLGYLPPVNAMPPIGTRPDEQTGYPAQVLVCARCGLAQLGLIVDPQVLFPPEYPYTSGTTRILRENFAELAREVRGIVDLRTSDLVIDIGSNDGTLLANFKDGHRVLGIEPTNTGELARARGIPTVTAFLSRSAVRDVVAREGQAALVTATNVFAHMEDVHEATECMLELLRDDGLFVSESHYWISLLETYQYDTIYHEHQRYYSLRSLAYLLREHGLDVFHAKRIPTHGGSIRVYAARSGRQPVRPSVQEILDREAAYSARAVVDRFRHGVATSKLGLLTLLDEVKRNGGRVFGVGAPSRATTLIHYVGLDDSILDCVVEIEGSQKIGKYMPGTLIPVVSERRLFEEQPSHALLLSWHIGDELIPKFRARGFEGTFIYPLPAPRTVGA